MAIVIQPHRTGLWAVTNTATGTSVATKAERVAHEVADAARPETIRVLTGLQALANRVNATGVHPEPDFLRMRTEQDPDLWAEQVARVRAIKFRE